MIGLYKKIYLAVGLAVGILQGLVFSIKSGPIIGVFTGVVSGVIVGGVVAVVMRSMYEDKAGEYSYKTTLKFNLKYEEVFALCETAVGSINNSKVKLRDISQGKLVAKLGMTWTATGEVITFQITKMMIETFQ